MIDQSSVCYISVFTLSGAGCFGFAFAFALFRFYVDLPILVSFSYVATSILTRLSACASLEGKPGVIFV